MRYRGAAQTAPSHSRGPRRSDDDRSGDQGQSPLRAVAVLAVLLVLAVGAFVLQGRQDEARISALEAKLAAVRSGDDFGSSHPGDEAHAVDHSLKAHPRHRESMAAHADAVHFDADKPVAQRRVVQDNGFMWNFDEYRKDVPASEKLAPWSRVAPMLVPDTACADGIRVILLRERHDDDVEHPSDDYKAFWNAVTYAVEAVCPDVHYCRTLDHYLALVRETPRDVVVITDKITILTMRESQRARHFDAHACRYRMIDLYGTSPAQAELHPVLRKLSLKQYWTPYPYTDGRLDAATEDTAWNTPVHFVVRPTHPSLVHSANGGERKHQGVVHIRHKYHGRMMRPLFEHLMQETDVELVAMASEEDAQYLPEGVKNLGLLPFLERQKVFLQSKFLLGMENPVLTFEPYEAIAAGCTFLNPTLLKHIAHHGNADIEVHSQHDVLARLGEPYVMSVQMHDHHQIEDTVRRALGKAGRFDPIVPLGNRFGYVAATVDAAIATDFCEKER